MMFQPAVLALLFAAMATAGLTAVAALFGLRILLRWNLASGGALQLSLERQTYLVSTLLGIALTAELLSLLLFVFNADRMATLFTGAMCAVGTLNANQFGFPALMLKVGLFFLAAVWLILNYVDNRGYDYPLIRPKYALLLLLAPLAAIAAATEILYFKNLKADVITSCCGSLFSPEAEAVTADLAGMAPGAALGLFYAALAGAVLLGLAHWRSGRFGYSLATAGGLAFIATMIAVISVVSPYIYEHPNHHCPFCILKPEYWHVGYLIYVPLFAGTASALGIGAVRPFRKKASLAAVIPGLSRNMAGFSALMFLAVGLAAGMLMLNSRLILFEAGS